MFFGADYSQQHCPLWSAALPTIVGSIADHCQHQKMYGFYELKWLEEVIARYAGLEVKGQKTVLSAIFL